jgi:small subunit ribosomal protein S16
MLTIKLAKVGKKNKKMFRLVISEKSRDPYGRALEILGSYNPYSKELKVKGDRVKYWISKGSSMTPSVNNLLLENKVIEGEKKKNSKVGEPNKRKVAKVEKAKQKEEEKKKQEEEAKKATEAPVETPAEAPVETPAEAPAEVPAETPGETPVEAPVETVTEEKTEEKQ